MDILLILDLALYALLNAHLALAVRHAHHVKQDIFYQTLLYVLLAQQYLWDVRNVAYQHVQNV